MVVKMTGNIMWFISMGLDGAQARMSQALLKVESLKNQNKKSFDIASQSTPIPIP